MKRTPSSSSKVVSVSIGCRAPVATARRITSWTIDRENTPLFSTRPRQLETALGSRRHRALLHFGEPEAPTGRFTPATSGATIIIKLTPLATRAQRVDF